MHHLSTDRAMLQEVTVRDLMGLEWMGDDKAREFYEKWIEIESRIEAGSVPEDTKKGFLWSAIRQSDSIKLAVYSETSKPKAEQTYSGLMDAFRRYLKDKKDEENYKKAIGKKIKSTVAPAQEPALDESR